MIDGVTSQSVNAIALGALVASRDGIGNQKRRTLAFASHDHRVVANREVPLATRGFESDAVNRICLRNVHRGNIIPRQ